jgi:hypothetical protein
MHKNPHLGQISSKPFPTYLFTLFVVILVFIIIVVVVVVTWIHRFSVELVPQLDLFVLDQFLVVGSEGKLGLAAAGLTGQVQAGLGFRPGPGLDGGLRGAEHDRRLEDKAHKVVEIYVLLPSLVLDGVAVPQRGVLGLGNGHVGTHLAGRLLLSPDGDSRPAENGAGCGRKHGICVMCVMGNIGSYFIRRLCNVVATLLCTSFLLAER